MASSTSPAFRQSVASDNRASKASSKYPTDSAAAIEARQALFNWWTALNAMEKALTTQKKFNDAKMVATVRNRAVEVAFNFYRIEPQNISDKYGIVIFSLIFYVVYTLWYGFAILFMFEGWGMKMEH